MPRLRLVTFPNAGSSETVYTGMDKTAFDGESGRRDNYLMKWAKANSVEVYAVQPPGRDARMKERALESCAEIAAGAMDQLESVLFGGDDVPWALFAHSMGTWCALEFAKLAPKPPSVVVASAFPSPSLERRPWNDLDTLGDDEAFKTECRAWNINEIVFSDAMWKVYEPLLRADFRCFNDYPVASEAEFDDFPIRLIYGTTDSRCTKAVVEGSWKGADVKMLDPVEGNHLFPYDERARRSWFRRVTEAIDSLQPLLIYECIGRKGAACRTGCELTTSLVEPEIQPGWTVRVSEEKKNLKGTDRLHIVSYQDGNEIDAWGSKKLFKYVGFVPPPKKVSKTAVKNEEEEEPEVVAAARVEDAPVGTSGKLYSVSGKSGAMLRSGAELDTKDLDLTLPLGADCYVVQEKTNSQGSLRARIARYSVAGEPWREVDGWCTAKFLLASSEGKAEDPLPEVGTKPFKTVFSSPNGSGGVVVLFPGQGAQKVGMVSAHLDTPGVKAMFQEASALFDGEDLLEIVQKGPVEKLNDTRFSQVCVFLTSLAAMKTVAHQDPSVIAKAEACAGFSLGEYTALAFAGVLDLETALKLLKLRGEAMGAACEASDVQTGMLTVVGIEDAKLTELMANYADCSVANQLFPKGRVLSGPKDQLSTLDEKIKSLGVAGSKTIVQPVSGAFHSKYMQPAADALKKALEEATFHPPQRVVYSNVTAKPHDSSDVESIKAKMVEQLTAGVLWEDTVREIATRFPNTANFYEPGPGKQLSSMMRRIEPANMPKMKNV